jgi:hypothetical protein
MALSVDPQTFIISVPQADLTLISGTIYELDTDVFRLALKDWEDDATGGITFQKTHTHNTEATVAGVTYARTVEILPPYSVEFEDGQYTVILKGSNNNIFDVENGILEQNQVQVVPTNAAGLIVYSSSSTTHQFDYVAADNGTNATFGVWLEENGTPRTDLDSIALVLKDTQGSTIHNFGVNNTPGVDGVYEFTVASGTLTEHTAYYLIPTATKGVDTWATSMGLSTG